MTARRPLIALIAALALVPAACGGDDENAVSDPGQTGSTTQPGGETAEGAGGSATIVTMKDFAFAPTIIKVKVGEKVTWKNEDTAEHDATGEDGGLKTPLIGNGETTDFTPDKAGTIKYICSIHPYMKGTIEVTEG